jgi:hypothetical protein
MTWADAGIETITAAASTRTVVNRKDFMLTSLVGLGLRCIKKLTVRSVDFTTERANRVPASDSI